MCKDELIILTAIINKKDIHWRKTITKSSNKEYTAENEVRVKNRAVIRLINIERGSGDSIEMNVRVIAKIH
jgi:hypothetical protein